MSKKKRDLVQGLSINADEEKPVDSAPNLSSGNLSTDGALSLSRWKSLGKVERLAVIGIVLLLTSVVLGATGLGKSIGDALTGDSANQTTQSNSQSLTLNPVTIGTPQLSKEYIYAGSRMLAVEDANANAAPPADLAVWRPSSGYWYVMGAGGSMQASQQWGASGDITVPGDYDGDGKTDIAVYRPSNGTWYAVKSSDPNSYLIQQFGISSDKPAPADYDGDGKADIGLWRGSDSTFYSLKSSNGQAQGAILAQIVSETPVSSDYDGDGKADFAVKSGNSWIIKQSSNKQQVSITWQQSGDREVQNDYDGDGKVDIAVWRNSTGDWYIRNSSTGQLRYEHWGQAGDIPVPAFYRR